MRSAFKKALDRIPHIPPAKDEEPFFYLNHCDFDSRSAVIQVQPRYVESQGSYLCPREVTISEIPLLDGKTRSPKDRDTPFHCGTRGNERPLSTFVGLCKELSDEMRSALETCKTKGEQSTNEEVADQYAKGYRALERAQVQFPAWANRQAIQIMNSLNSVYTQEFLKMRSEIDSSSDDEAIRLKLEADDYMSKKQALLSSQCLEYQNYHSENVFSRISKAESGRLNQSIEDATEGFKMTEIKTSGFAWRRHRQTLKQRAGSLIGMKSKGPTIDDDLQELLASSMEGSTAGSVQNLATVSTDDSSSLASGSGYWGTAAVGPPIPGLWL